MITGIAVIRRCSAIVCRLSLKSPTTKSVGYPNDVVRSGECTDTSLFRLDDAFCRTGS